MGMGASQRGIRAGQRRPRARKGGAEGLTEGWAWTKCYETWPGPLLKKDNMGTNVGVKRRQSHLFLENTEASNQLINRRCFNE